MGGDDGTPADAIRETLAALRSAGEGLRRRPARKVLEVLGVVLDRWCDPRSEVRRTLAELHPDTSGLSPETVTAGLAHGLEGAGWRGAALESLAASELGTPDALETTVGPPVVAVVHGGVIPMPTLLDVLAALLVRSPVLAKPAARDPVTPRLVMQSLAEADAELGACVALADFRRDDAASLGALLEADRVLVTGSDVAVAAVVERAGASRCLAHGHGVSVATWGADLVDPDAAAERLAVDVALWDQLGCLSPVACYGVGASDAALDAFADALARALAGREAAWPRGEIDAEAAALVAAERAGAEWRAAAGRSVAVHAGAGTSWTVIREDDAELRPAPLHRFVRVHPVADVDALERALTPLARHLAAVALEGFGAGTAEVERRVRALGASRTCRFGALQSPPLTWRRDHLPVLPVAGGGRR
jgi:acyl-CoA reductase-like NAD-dependent aldehyde dehydrogenase